MKLIDRLNPAVSKQWLLLSAGIVWSGVGILLCSLAFGWLKSLPSTASVWIAAAGLLLSLAVYYFGFSRIARTNVNRLRGYLKKVCLFAFFPWKSYLLMVIMMTGGMFLRHSAVPKPLLAVLYLMIGGGLFLSSLHYYPAALEKSKA